MHLALPNVAFLLALKFNFKINQKLSLLLSRIGKLNLMAKQRPYQGLLKKFLNQNTLFRGRSIGNFKVKHFLN